MLESFDQSEELQMFRDAVRKMSEKEFLPIAAQVDEEDAMPDKVMPLLGEMGLVQLQVPEEYGGPGGSLLMNCIAKEEVARHSFAISHLVGACDFAMVLPLRDYGTEEQRQKFLPEVAAGNITAAIGLTEPGTGSDVSGMKTNARRDGDHWVINGQKTFITKGDTAEYINVIARTSEGKGGNGLSSFLVKKGTPGLTVGGSVRKMGMRGIKSVDLFFEDLRVPAENMIGEEGMGFKNAMNSLNYNRPTVAASALGLSQGALDVAQAYANERMQFGKRIIEFQAIGHKLAEMRIQVEAARALLYRVCALADSGQTHALAEYASCAKAFASNAAMQITTEAVQVFGGAGYLRDNPVERMMRDAKVTQIYEGTTEIQKLIIARSMMAA